MRFKFSQSTPKATSLRAMQYCLKMNQYNHIAMVFDPIFIRYHKKAFNNMNVAFDW